MRIFVFGGSGLVGSSLIEGLKDISEITCTYNTNRIDLPNIKAVKMQLPQDKQKIYQVLLQEKPDVIIHTIAFSNVDYCETNKKEADELHVECTEEIARISSKINSKLIYVSTDWVFGDSKRKFSEEDNPNPVNHYGKTRQNAEKIVLRYSNKNVIIRPAVIYGWHPNSKFTNFVLKNLQGKKQVFAYTDQFQTPTLVDDLVNAVKKIIQLDKIGIFHTVGSSCSNRFEFAKIIAKQFCLDENLIIQSTTDEKPQVAKRPKISCLDNSKSASLLGIKFATIEEGIEKIFEKSKL